MPTFREQVKGELSKVLGEPVLVPVGDGILYRWVVKTQGGDTLRLTLDSPEFPDIAHLVISDTGALVRVESETSRTMEHFQLLLERIKERLKR